MQLLKHPFAEGSHDVLVRAADEAVLPLFRRPLMHEADQQQASPAIPLESKVNYEALAPKGKECSAVTCSS